MTKSVRMLNNGSTVLDYIFLTGQNVGNVKGLVYDNQAVKNKGERPGVKFVPPKKKHGKKMSNHMSQHQQRHQKKKNGGRNQQWRCHYYRRFGHLKSVCYRVHGYPKPVTHHRRKQTDAKSKSKRLHKNDSCGLIAHTSLRASAKED